MVLIVLANEITVWMNIIKGFDKKKYFYIYSV